MRIVRTAVAAAVSLALGAAIAQVPDAGRLLQENTPRPQAPRPAPPLDLQAPPSATGARPGGATVTVQSVRIEGLSALDPALVLAELPPQAGRTLDLAGMRELALQVEALVRRHGYPFARAYLPPQDLASGVLRIAVVEGRYGEVQARGDRAAQAREWLRPLRPGAPIAQGPLERSLLLLNDLPGVQAKSVLRPGAQPGTGDLLVDVEAASRVSGEVGVDNHGNRYAGRERVRGSVDIDSPFTLGDQLSARASYTVEGTWLASVLYALPLATSGWRAQLGLVRTDYELGREFASLGAHGTADIASLTLAYPLLRTRDASLRASAGWQQKWLFDAREATGSSERKRSRVVPLALGGDWRDDRSVTWGSAVLSLGRLELDAALTAADSASARTAGHFSKLNVDLARLQGLAPAWTLYGRLSTQWASRNLDSSEKFVLGGIYGLRAWPSGEAIGDEGWLAQVELRYRAGAFEPYLLLDGGGVRVNREPWAAGDNRRHIAGTGAGVRWATGPWSADAVAAYRLGHRASTTEPMADRLRMWLTLGYRF